jgi:hypothetical protein
MSIQLHTPPLLLKDLGLKYPTENSNYKKQFGIYLCHCGNEFETNTASVKSGHTKSCGCTRYENARKASTKHNLTHHPLYNIWNAMINRTTNSTHQSFSNYGGRGIKVCERWINVANFIDDMYPSYIDGLTIDRIDNNKGYDPSNCRWATKSIQSQNTRVIRTNNTSGYRGVTWNKLAKKWKATISVSNKSIYLGYFNSSIEAAKEYDKYVISHRLDHIINGVA